LADFSAVRIFQSNHISFRIEANMSKRLTCWFVFLMVLGLFYLPMAAEAAVGTYPASGNPNDYDGIAATWLGTLTADQFTNAGNLIGVPVVMGPGNDTFINLAGGTAGLVTLGAGNDAYIGHAGGLVFAVTGGDGNDSFSESGFSRFQLGLDGDDTISINRGGGSLLVAGGAGNDVITINSGAFVLLLGGGDGNDTITNLGTLGAALTGSGNDTLVSGGLILGPVDLEGGNDTLILQPGCDFNPGGSVSGGSDSDTLNLQGDQNWSFDGDFEAFEIFNKTGAGTWTLNGDVEVDTTGTIAAGTLLLNGTMGNGVVLTVDPGATLGGIGTITGNVINNGTLSPGNSIGTMTITGNYTQNAGSTLGVEVGSTTADLLDISGTATITGGTVAVTLLGSPADGATYDILTATGGHTGAASFDGVTSQSVVVSFTLDDTITANTISLVAERTPYANVLTGAYSGQRDFAAALQAALPSATGDLADWFTMLDQSSSKAEFAQKLKELNPSLYGALADIMGVEINLFNGVITTRMANVRESGTQFACASNVMTDSGPVMANVIAPSRTASGWSGWAQGFRIFADQDSDKGNVGFDYDTFGLAFGIDKSLGNNLLLGFSAGTAQTDVDYKDVTSDTDADTVHMGLYGTYSTKRYYVDACALYASNSYDTDRNIGIGTLYSDHDGHDFLVYFGGGYYYRVGEWDLIPTASLEYSYHDEDSFTESLGGTAFMRVSDSDADSVISRLGFRLGRLFMVQDMKLRGEVRAQWAHEFADTDRPVTARFAGSTAGSFTVDGIEPERDSAILGVGFTAYATETLSLYFNYDAELRSDFDAHHVRIGLRFDF
jgi:outer membrane autotransporter protein